MEAYHAVIEPTLDGTEAGGGEGTVSGTVVVITSSDLNSPGSGNLFYGGSLIGLEGDLESINCPAKNGCGVHIHSGRGCDDLLAQGGHYYDEDAFVLDPWGSAKYDTDEDGRAVFDGFVQIGGGKANDLAGRAFVVHSEDGSRVGCGQLKHANYATLAASLAGFKMSGTAYAFDIGDGVLCFTGTARGLSADQTCDPAAVPNSCGTHVHAGTSCRSPDEQGGHLFAVPEDPWKLVGYPATNPPGGETVFGRCVATGYPAGGAREKPFVVHEKDGGRVLCGLLEPYSGQGLGLGSGFRYGTAAVAVLATIGAGAILYAVRVFLKRRKVARRLVMEHQSDLELSGEGGYRDDDPSAPKSSEDDDAPKFEIT